MNLSEKDTKLVLETAKFFEEMFKDKLFKMLNERIDKILERNPLSDREEGIVNALLELKGEL